MAECVLAVLELQYEEAEGEHEELAVVVCLEDRVSDVADEVLEERADDNVD